MILDPNSVWSLHPQLAADTVPVGDLPLSRLLVSKDATYPWLILVPRRAGASEIIDLPESERTQLMAEIALVSEALKQLTACDKLNVAALGNIVPQLHIHIVARRKDDPAWPGPVWGHGMPAAYETAALARFLNRLRGQLPLGSV
jgi:diadenosine tetraphosphate (Ap4A) HIT family hydrolase